MDWIKINEAGEIEFVTEEVKLVPEVQALLTYNYNKQKGDVEGRKRVRAKTELKYLYLAYSLKSPYKDYTEKERIQQARMDCEFPDDWQESTELKLLIPKFNQGTQNRTTRLLRTVVGFLDKFETHLNLIDLDERTAAGTLVHSPKTIMDTLGKLPDMAETLTALEIQARTDVVRKTSSKGDHEIGWMSNKNAKVTKKEVEDDTDLST